MFSKKSLMLFLSKSILALQVAALLLTVTGEFPKMPIGILGNSPVRACG